MSEQFEFNFDIPIDPELEQFSRELQYGEKAVDHDQFMRAQKFREEATLLNKIFKKIDADKNIDDACAERVWDIIEDHLENNQRIMDSW